MKVKTFGKIVTDESSGLRVPEWMASRISALKSNDSGGLRRVAYPTEVTGDGERCDISTINTDRVDRDGEIILPGGIDLKEFAANPAVPWCHDYEQLPMGPCQWIKPTKDGRGIVAKTYYLPKPPDWGDAPWMPSAVLHMVQNGVCIGKSVGVLPQQVRRPNDAELRAHPEWDGSTVVSKSVMLEYSCCMFGVNPAAVTTAVSKGIRSGVFAEKDADLIRKMVMVETETEDQILTKSGGKYASVDFSAPDHVKRCMMNGADYHDANSHAAAEPEQLAMARHIGSGGHCSPSYAKKLKKWWDKNADHKNDIEGSKAHTLSMIHGGNGGSAFADRMVKSMESIDGPGLTNSDISGDLPPEETVEITQAPELPGMVDGIVHKGNEADPKNLTIEEIDAELTKWDAANKAMGASENVNADGGYATDDEAMKNMPECPTCKSAKSVKPVNVDKKMYACSMCKSEFNTDAPPDPNAEKVAEEQREKAELARAKAMPPRYCQKSVTAYKDRIRAESEKSMLISVKSLVADELARAMGVP